MALKPGGLEVGRGVLPRILVVFGFIIALHWKSVKCLTAKFNESEFYRHL